MASDVVKPSPNSTCGEGKTLKLNLATQPFMRIKDGKKRNEYRMVKARITKQLEQKPSRALLFCGYESKKTRQTPLHFKISRVEEMPVEEIPDEEDMKFMIGQISLQSWRVDVQPTTHVWCIR